jgi:hypothetical protein
MYTSGFNPLPRLDFASPISLGLSSEAEIATVDVSRLGIADEFIEKMNLNLPDGFSIIKTLEITIPMGVKKRSAASLLWGFGYLINGSNEIIMVPHAEEKSFRSKYSELGYSLFDMNRKMVFAQTDKKTPVSYFEAFSCFYS